MSGFDADIPRLPTRPKSLQSRVLPIDGASSPRNTAELLINDSSSVESRDAGRIVGWRHLDDIAAHNVQVGYFSQYAQEFEGSETACHGRSGAGREGRIKAVDIDRKVARTVADTPTDAITNLLDREIVARGIVKDCDAKRIIHPGPDPDLNGAAGIYHTIGRSCP